MLTTDFVPGAPNWLDLGAPDTEAARAFYGGLLGWSFESAGPEAGGYGFFTHGRETVAALRPLPPPPGPGPPGPRTSRPPTPTPPRAPSSRRAATCAQRRSTSSTRGGW